MINITKQNNSLVVVSDNKYQFPFQNGTITLPMNSVFLVVDESTMVTFRSVANADILFSADLSELKIDGASVTKDNIADKFADAATSDQGGFKYEVVDELPSEGEKGTIYLVPNEEGTHTEYLYVENVGWEQVGLAKVDLSDYYTKEEVDEGNRVNAAAFNVLQKSIGLNENLETLSGKSIQAQIDEVKASVPTDYVTNEALDEVKESIPTQFKTINNESIVGEGNIEIQGGSDNAYEKVSSVTIDDNQIRVFKEDGVPINNTATTITNTGVTISDKRTGVVREQVSFDYNKLSYNTLSTNWTLTYQKIKDSIDKVSSLPTDAYSKSEIDSKIGEINTLLETLIG